MMEVSGRMLVLLATAVFGVFCTATTSQEFHCTEPGKFLIPESCQEYYACRESQSSLTYLRRKCPEGKIFDDDRKRCLLPHRVSSRPACTNTVAPTDVVVADVASFDSCSNIPENIPKIINTSNELCPHIRAIENYVNKLISGIPIRTHYIRDAKHTEEVTSYDTALQNAQNAVNIWRNGNDLLSDIKRTYNLVKNYESDFDHKYRVNARRLKTISSSSSSQDRKSSLKSDIEALKEEIQSIESIVKMNPSAAVKALFDNQLARKRDEIRRKEQSLKETSGNGPVFNELEAFLEMVTETARNVENKAKETQNRMDEWDTNILIASSELRSQSVKIEQLQENLKNDAESHEAAVAKCRKDIEEYNSQVNSLRNSTFQLENKIEANLKKIRDATAAILKKTHDHEREQHRVCEENGVSETHDCTSIFDPSCEMKANLCLFLTNLFLAPLNLTEDNEKLEQLRLVTQEQNQKLNNQNHMIINQLEIIRKDISQKEDDIEEHRRKILQAKSEQNNLNFHSDYQAQVWLAEDSAFSAIEAIKSGLQEVDCTFHTIREGMEGMAARARTAKGAGEEHAEDVLKVKDSIDQSITELHKIIDQSGDKVNPLSCL